MKFLRSLPRRHVRDTIMIIVLVALVSLTWSWYYHRLDFASWGKPVSIGGDGLLIASGAQAAAEGDFTPWLFKTPHRLGAPFTAEWNSWPITEEFLFWTIGMVSKITGMPAAESLVMMAAHALAAAAFYLACRLLGKRRLYSAIFAALFGLCYYIFHRGLGHLTVGYCWHVPLCWAVVCFAFSKRGLFKNRRRVFIALAVAIITGLQNPYHTFIFGQFLGVAFVVQALRRRPWKVVAAPAVIAAVLMAVFVSMQADTLLDHVVNHRGALSAQRSYMDIELYALKPLDLVLPLGWRLPFLSRQTEDYRTEKVVTGEFPMAFLGVVAVAGALLLGCLAFRDLLLRDGRLSAVVRQYAVPTLWIVAVGMVGGVLAMGALLTGAYFLRAADRFSVYIVALLLFFLVDFFTSTTRRLPIWAQLAVGCLPLFAGAVELYISHPRADALVGQGMLGEQYGQFVSEIEKSAGPSAMLFNLPAVEFPEIVPLNQEDVYAPLLLYVARPSGLRFSYGNMRGSYCDAWQQACSHLPPEQMAAELRRYGFGGVVVSCAAYPDKAAALLASLSAATGQPAITTPGGDLAFVPLAPTPITGGVKPATANISMADGWWPIEYDTRGHTLQWTHGDAVMALYRDPALGAQTPAVISMTLNTPAERTLRVSCGGKTLVTLAMRPNVNYILESLRVPVRPGWNLLHFRTDQPPTRRPDVPLDTRDVVLVATDVRASGLARNGEALPIGAPLPADGAISADTRAALSGAAMLEATDPTGRVWREFRGEGAPTNGTVGEPAQRIDFLPDGQSFCLLVRITPGPKQTDFASPLSSLTPDFHGFIMAQQGNHEGMYDCAIGDGTQFSLLGEPIQFSAGHSYLIALNVSGQDLTVRLRGDDGLDKNFTHRGPEIAEFSRSYWRWGNWIFESRPFTGGIELLSMSGPLSVDTLEQLIKRHESEFFAHGTSSLEEAQTSNP